MYTILQKQQDDSFNVVAKVIDDANARAIAETLCNRAGVVRTIVLDDLGYVTAVES
jgi:hypothetical protein